ncbi:MAG: hypothetical protein ACI4MK_12570 [Aristaeellaceae bacterium]
MTKKIILLALALAVLLVPAALLNTRQGVYAGDVFLPRTENSYGPVTMTLEDSATVFSGTAADTDFTAVLCRDGDMVSIAFADGATLTGHWDGANLCNDDGTPYAYTSHAITVTVGDEPSPLGQAPLADVLCRMAFGVTEAQGSLHLLVLGTVLYVLGSLYVLIPEKMYFLGRQWVFSHAELSDMGRLGQVIGGWVLLAAAAIIMYFPLFTSLL